MNLGKNICVGQLRVGRRLRIYNEEGTGRESGGRCRGSRAAVGRESLEEASVWRENPGESEVVKTKRPESSKAPEGMQDPCSVRAAPPEGR